MKHLTLGIRFLCMMVGLACSLAVSAQNITVSGTVTDSEGEPLIGASVLVQGSSSGTATDIDGNYKLQAPANGTLTFSYVGCNPETVAINGRTTIDVTLSENSVVLGEVVAIGYGVVKKSDATGSVAMVKPDDVEAGMANSAQDLLVGASPGVVVTTNGGDPTGNATIRIRGGSSLNASNDPLIVVDGMPMTNQSSGIGTNALSTISPQDIESMTILKDASATAIYGSRASNGVILITTKKGSAGRPKVTFSANWHVNSARKTLDLMNASQFKQAIIDNFGQDAYDTYKADGWVGDADTDWQKEVLRTSFSQDYSLSVGGTAGFLPYRVNASFTDNQGILKESSMQRTTVGFSLNPKFFNGKLSINANAQGSYIRNKQADQGAIGAATSFNPTMPVHTAYKTTGNAGITMYDGYTQAPITPGTGLPDDNGDTNPLTLLEKKRTIGKQLQSNGNLQIDYALHFLPELHLNLNLGYEVSQNKQKTENDANTRDAWTTTQLNVPGGIQQRGAARLYDWYELQRNTLLSFYLNYRKDFQAIRSNLDVTAGYDWQKFDYHGRSHTELASGGYDMSYDALTQTWNVDNAPAQADYPIGSHIGSDSQWSAPLQLVSFYGRLNYIYDNTYLLTVTLRDDGTSRFSKDNRWGLFPAVALGWKMSEMPFFEGIRDKWNELKLRLGWGETGQQAVKSSYFPYLPIYTQGSKVNYWYPNYGAAGWIEDPLIAYAYNSNLKWETTTTWNIGLDMAWLNNRITLAADWYLRDTRDLIADVNVAGLNVGEVTTQNIGTLRNVGVEVTIGAKPVVTRDFVWNTAFNVAYNQNKITSLGTVQEQPGAIGAVAGTGGNLTAYRVGEPANVFRVYEQVYDQAGDPLPGVFVDQNGDGVIDAADKISYHNPAPKWTMSWNNNFNYKNWDLGITLRANLGNYVYNKPKLDRTMLAGTTRYGLHNLLNDSFLFPADTDQNMVAYSSYFVENASFLRCDNITLGYTFDNIANGKLNLRVFGAVQNPFVITKYKGLDPEVESGFDSNVYPRPITGTLGVVVNF